jgi:hypothetical protein
MFLGSLEAPERVGGVPVPVEELDGLARVVQHVFRGQALRLRDIPAIGQYLEILFYTHIGCFFRTEQLHESDGYFSKKSTVIFNILIIFTWKPFSPPPPTPSCVLRSRE